MDDSSNRHLLCFRMSRYILKLLSISTDVIGMFRVLIASLDKLGKLSSRLFQKNYEAVNDYANYVRGAREEVNRAGGDRDFSNSLYVDNQYRWQDQSGPQYPRTSLYKEYGIAV